MKFPVIKKIVWMKTKKIVFFSLSPDSLSLIRLLGCYVLRSQDFFKYFLFCYVSDNELVAWWKKRRFHERKLAVYMWELLRWLRLVLIERELAATEISRGILKKKSSSHISLACDGRWVGDKKHEKNVQLFLRDSFGSCSGRCCSLASLTFVQCGLERKRERERA